MTRSYTMQAIGVDAQDDPVAGDSYACRDDARPDDPGMRDFASVLWRDAVAGFADKGWKPLGVVLQYHGKKQEQWVYKPDGEGAHQVREPLLETAR